MSETSQTYRFKWRGIEIEACYTPVKWEVIAHLEIKSINPIGTPLPMTKTGYRSHYHPIGTIEASGYDIISYVRAWLDKEAERPKWKRAELARRQGDLFV